MSGEPRRARPVTVRAARSGRDQWISVNGECPLAWQDDELAVRAENATMAARSRRRRGRDEDEREIPAVAELRKRAKAGEVPQLRMALGSGDSIWDYLSALGDKTRLVRIRSRAAARYWGDGGCRSHGGPDYGEFRSPDLPYLAAMLTFTYGPGAATAQPELEPPPESEPGPASAQAELGGGVT